MSGESVQSHLSWLRSVPGLAPSFPLVSDPGSLLAQSWSVPGAPGPGEESGDSEASTRAVVITDNKAVMLETVSSSLSSQDLVSERGQWGFELYFRSLIISSFAVFAEVIRSGAVHCRQGGHVGGEEEEGCGQGVQGGVRASGAECGHRDHAR